MNVLVECYHDAALARALGVSKQKLFHEGSKGKVINRLRDAASEAVGLLDEDPQGGGRPAELKRYTEKARACDLSLLEHREAPQKRIVEVCPRLEEWLIQRAALSHIPLAHYGLPATARELHRDPRCDRKPEFHRFLADLLAVDDGMRTLKKWLKA